jgi:DNA replication protein DnaC
MNTETLTKMKRMRLHGMHSSFQMLVESKRNEQLTSDECIAQLINSEWDERHHRALARSTKRAHFRYRASIEQIDFSAGRGIDKNKLHRLADGSFITKNENLLITGPTGTGKSFLASALGHQACLLGFKVLYTNTARLLAQLKMAKADGSVMKEMIRIEKIDLLIFDDFGIQPFDAINRSCLLEIIEDRHGKHSTIFTSQLPVKQWYDVIGDATIADAILDRIVHTAHRIELIGESMRRKVNQQTDDTMSQPINYQQPE